MEILWLIIGHFLGDFAFQTSWIANRKGKSWKVNGYHAFIYAATIFAVAYIGGIILSPLALMILLISHFIIDPLKSRWGIVKSTWVDQILHFIVLGIIVFFFL